MKELCEELVTKEDRKIAQELKEIDLYLESETPLRLKIYSKTKRKLADIVSLLESFDLTPLDIVSYTLIEAGVYIYALTIEGNMSGLLEHQNKILEAMKKVLMGQEILQCRLYSLITHAGFDLERVQFVRAMAKYLDQLLPEKKERSILSTLLRYPEITRDVTDIFFNNRADVHFGSIKNYEDHRLFTIFSEAIKNIKKHNFFHKKETKSFKFDTNAFKHLLLGLQPNIEIFVYHPRFIGVHLRVAKVARGGIRYSDREDVREEIKALMITQEAKNAIIVPSGAKGGFFPFFKPNKEEFAKLYKLYIDALLDVIDLTPSKGEDFYFVVAADRGTAQMSDTANEIAQKKGFWLGDAFASGGSSGYSHKKLGVTAKGAWHSASWHFHKRNIDIFKETISVVATGSMRGDVFGNGMLINPNIHLVAAISSTEIFIDPSPNLAIAYEERKRLFQEQKSWDAYDKSKISEGGGVFLREDPAIDLSPQIQKLIGTKKKRMNGEELARELLKLPVDLLYIGGIGTYVKSSEELNIYIQDKFNEGVRVDASDLRCFAICEGGNLGLTQKARIEYAKNGGHINLDHIDNSAGVHTSDYEVNIKIALKNAIESNKIDLTQRDKILHSLTNQVLEKVFSENIAQPLIITLDQLNSKENMSEYIKAIEILEKHVAYFKRKDHEIPKTSEINRIINNQDMMVRPALGILLSYTKIFLKELLLRTQLIDEPFFEHYLYKYFPKGLYPIFEKEVLTHPLKRRIIATTVANIIVDQMGVRFICDYEELGEELFLVKIKAFMVLYSLLSIAKVKKELIQKRFELGVKLYEMLTDINESLDFSLRWIIKNHQELNIEPFHILNYKQEIAKFLGYEEKIAQNFFHYIDLVKFIMLAIYLKENSNYSLRDVLSLLLHIISTFKIDTLLNYLHDLTPKNETAKEIKNHLIQLTEYFVTLMAKEIILFTRSHETLHDGLEGFLQEKMIDTQKLQEAIEAIAKDPNDLTYLVNVVHKLLLSVI